MKFEQVDGGQNPKWRAQGAIVIIFNLSSLSHPLSQKQEDPPLARSETNLLMFESVVTSRS